MLVGLLTMGWPLTVIPEPAPKTNCVWPAANVVFSPVTVNVPVWPAVSTAGLMLEKNPVVLRAAKQAYKHVRHMNWEQSADYLASKMDQVSVQDRSDGRSAGMKQFLDDKSFRPGLEPYKRPASE